MWQILRPYPKRSNFKTVQDTQLKNRTSKIEKSGRPYGVKFFK